MENKERVWIEEIVQEVVKKLREYGIKEGIPVGVSNRHVHLSQEDLDILFGKDYALTRWKELGQPGQFAAKETLEVIGPKGSLTGVRILGPVRDQTQVEVSLTDGHRLGMMPPIRESGDLSQTPGMILKGPKGLVQKDRGVIAALRHIHMRPEEAAHFGVQDKEEVAVMMEGRRKTVFYNVLIRVSEEYALEMHIDTDESNAAGIKNGDKVKIWKD